MCYFSRLTYAISSCSQIPAIFMTLSWYGQLFSKPIWQQVCTILKEQQTLHENNKWFDAIWRKDEEWVFVASYSQMVPQEPQRLSIFSFRSEICEITEICRGQRGSDSPGGHWQWSLLGVGWEESGVPARGIAAPPEAGWGRTDSESAAKQAHKQNRETYTLSELLQ